MNEILKKRIEEAADDLSMNESPYYYQAFIDGAEYAISHQYISAKYDLPEYDEAVIVAYGNEEYGFSHRSNNPDVLTDKNGFCNYCGKEIIGWMPIPKFEPKS